MTSFLLKLIAIAGMTCNHAAYLFAAWLPYPAYCLLEGLGGLTFPVMAFLLAEGWRHTSNVWRYGLRLALFALVSQVPYALFLGWEGNVMFTLLAGLALLHLREALRNRALWWLTAVALAVFTLGADWGLIGVAMVLVAGLAPARLQRSLGMAALPAAAIGIPALAGLAAGDATALPALLYAAGNLAAGGLLLLYDGRRGRPLKWFFYVYYPAHIAVLGVVRGVLLGVW